MTRHDIVLALQGVTKAFGGLKVLSDVGFEVRAGERMALIGPNGAGKTTVFNLISGAYPIDQGAILLQGTNIADVPASRRPRMGIARSFQNIRLMPHLSVVENVIVGQHARARGLADLREFLLRVAERGVTLMVVEHDMSLVRRLCDHTVVLNFGRKIYDGPIGEVQDDPAVLEAYLGPGHQAADDARVAAGASRHAS